MAIDGLMQVPRNRGVVKNDKKKRVILYYNRPLNEPKLAQKILIALMSVDGREFNIVESLP